MTPQLSRLQGVPLREIWTHEAHAFTPWLAEHLDLLGEVRVRKLALASQERNIGLFRADIVATDENTNETVLIENQLERTDHGHLGQIIAYAAGMRASTVVWIAEHIISEHRVVIDWMNEMMNGNVRFFAVEIEVWRIGASRTAPCLRIVCKPHDWTQTGVRAVNYREAIAALMASGEDLTYVDISERLGCSLATVKKHGPRIKAELTASPAME
jgi:hypothetical protein